MERELLFKITRDDFDEFHIRGSGPGGQHRNKTATGVRLVHRDSGAVGVATDDKSQNRNRIEAWKRLRQTPTFIKWFDERCRTAMQQPSLASLVDKAMAEDNIITEVKDDNGRWSEVADLSSLT